MGAWMCRREHPERILFLGLDAAGKTTILYKLKLGQVVTTIPTIGLDAAGKTTILYKLKLGQVVTTIPTIGFNVESINMDGIEIMCWDVGGRDKIRPLYKHYLNNTTGAVYVIDSCDRERLEEAVDELFTYFLKDDITRNMIFMVLANKQDKNDAMTCQEIEVALKKKMEKEGLLWNQTLFVYPVSATEGDGLFGAFSCFLKHMKLKKAEQVPKGLITVDIDNGDKNKDSLQIEMGHEGLGKKLLQDPMKYIKSLLFY